MKKLGNKGLTLVELIVAFAIFSIVGIAVCAFISFVSKNFAISNTNVKLQYEQQLVVNRVRDDILETSRGISFDTATKKLVIFSDNPEYDPDVAGSSPYYVSEFRYAVDANGRGNLYYGYDNNIPKGTPMADILSMSFTELSICDSISEFEVDLSKLKEGEVLLTMTFKVGEKTLTVNPVISLRNVISEVDDDVDLDDLYEGAIVEVYSPVAKVEIVRDGKVFGQSRTDTIKMADGSATVDYDAIVTKKKTYKGDIDLTVTWSLDLSSLKSGYENCISLSGDGLVSVKNYTDGGGVEHEPSEYMKSDYFVLVATSNEDTTKSARLRIKVTGEGVYPVSLSSSYTTEADLENGKLIYHISHSVSYTGLFEDPVTKEKVNPLTGEGAYKVIKYVSCVDEEGNEPPKGSGFSSLNKVDGTFIASKSMENHTYTIKVQVLQKDKDGQVVEDTVTINIPEGSIPDKVEVKKPVLSVSEPALRGDYTTMSAAWSSGVPEYKENENSDATTAYNYWYEWTITNNDDPKWNTTSITLEDGTVLDTSYERTNFEDLIFFSSGNEYDGKFNQGRKVTTDKLKRTHMVYIKPYLDWRVNYTFKVELRVKISKGTDEASALYYKLPQKDTDKMEDMTTDSPADAYVSSQVVTVAPVKLTLEPAKGVVFYNNNQVAQGLVNSTFSTSTTVGKGIRPEPAWQYDWTKSQQAKDYYKIFTPSFEGISVNIFNYKQNIYNNNNIYDDNANDGSGIATYLTKDKNNNVTASALQPYTTEANGIFYIKDNTTGFASGIRVLEGIDNKLYFYLKITPAAWIDTGKQVSGCKWVCMVRDTKKNETTAKFKMPVNEKNADEGFEITDFVNYTIKNAYEGEY